MKGVANEIANGKKREEILLQAKALSKAGA